MTVVFSVHVIHVCCIFAGLPARALADFKQTGSSMQGLPNASLGSSAFLGLAQSVLQDDNSNGTVDAVPKLSGLASEIETIAKGLKLPIKPGDIMETWTSKQACSKPAEAARNKALKELRYALAAKTAAYSANAWLKRFACNGWQPTSGKYAGMGGSCKNWKRSSITWCFVEKLYEGTFQQFKKQSEHYGGKFVAPCAVKSSEEDKVRDRKKAALAIADTRLKNAINFMGKADVMDKDCIAQLTKKADKLMKNGKLLEKNSSTVANEARKVLKIARLAGCLLWAPVQGSLSGTGGACKPWGFSSHWCFVEKGYTGYGNEFVREASKAEVGVSGKFYAPCNMESEKRAESIRKQAVALKNRATVLMTKGKAKQKLSLEKSTLAKKRLKILNNLHELMKKLQAYLKNFKPPSTKSAAK
eukprot:TRINITY_DN70196_c0_g1_i1.p1 TRINITY_DN70196_c0_g1~~TRINITY_DN70196_c0_g1_i1.p1  ORF type:complete len:416 (+),score=78.65 TRINITY_DN70196_c0_g1_i1:135-1382(+)